jgi:hypothetical protein
MAGFNAIDYWGTPTPRSTYSYSIQATPKKPAVDGIELVGVVGIRVSVPLPRLRR